MQRDIDYPDNAWVAVPINFGPYNDYWVVHFNNYNVKKFVKISVKVAEAVVQAFSSGKAEDGQHAYPTLSIIAHGHGLTGDIAHNTITGGTVTSFTFQTSGAEGVASTTISGFTPQNAVTFFDHMMEQPTDYSYVVSLMAGDTVATVQKGAKAGAYFDTGAGDDTVTGGDGNDTALKWNPGDLVYQGGKGTDLLQLRPMEDVVGEVHPTKGALVDLRTGTGQNPFGGTFKLKSVENVYGTEVADVIYGSEANNVIGDGRYDIGADQVRTYGGNDTVRWGFGETGAFADGGKGSDTLQFVLTEYDASKVHELDLADPSKNKGIFASNTAKNFENLIQSTDLTPDGVTVNFIGNDAANRVMTTAAGNIDLAGGNDSFTMQGAAKTVDGGGGKDDLFANGFFGDMLDLADQSKNTGTFAGSTFKNFDVFHSDGFNFIGSKAAETYLGSSSFETVNGGGGDDVLKGGNGADILTGGAGNDRIDGGDEAVTSLLDNDVAIFSGVSNKYHVSFKNGAVTIRDARPGSPDGADTITGVERFQFSDQVLSLADLIGKGPSIAGGLTHTYAVKEGTLAVADIGASDSFGDKEGDGLSYKIIRALGGGEPDGGAFSIDAITGEIAFYAKPDFEHPFDSNGDNVYRLTVRVTDSNGINDDQTVIVKVENVAGQAVSGGGHWDLAATDEAPHMHWHHDLMI